MYRECWLQLVYVQTPGTFTKNPQRDQEYTRRLVNRTHSQPLAAQKNNEPYAPPEAAPLDLACDRKPNPLEEPAWSAFSSACSVAGAFSPMALLREVSEEAAAAAAAAGPCSSSAAFSFPPAATALAMAAPTPAP